MYICVCKETAVSSCSVESLLFAYPNYTLQTVVAIGTFSVGYKIHTRIYAREVSKETSNSSYSHFIYDVRSFQYVNCVHITRTIYLDIALLFRYLSKDDDE